MSSPAFRPWILALLPLCTAIARAQTIERASVDNLGVEGDGSSLVPRLSGDGRFVAFESQSAQLAAGDTNGVGDVFVRDRVLGTTRLASLGGQFESGRPAISNDGLVVAFESWSENWDPRDQNGWQDVYVYDAVSGIIECVSLDATGATSNKISRNASISADGRFVAFESRARLAANDTDFVDDVYVRDRLLGTTELVSVDAAGNNGTTPALQPVISGNGDLVAFLTFDAFDTRDTNGIGDIYLRDRIGNTTQLVSVHPVNGVGDDQSFSPSMSLDGFFIAFESDATNLDPADTNHTRDVFVFDLNTHTVARASLGAGGAQADGPSLRAAIAGDGRSVAFESSATNLVAGDVNGQPDIFVRDMVAGTTHRVDVNVDHLESNDQSYFSSLSFDGSIAAFSSLATNLVPGDTNGVDDVFVRSMRPLFSAFCAGDGSGTPCPCGNDSAPGAGRGCLNSQGLGARLVAAGEPRVGANDTLVLGAADMTSSLALFVQGSAPANGGAGVVLNDGLGCWGGQLVRLRTRPIVAGTSQYPQAGDPKISALGSAQPGDTRYYQVVYRNSAMTYCPPATANTSNGIELTWTF